MPPSGLEEPRGAREISESEQECTDFVTTPSSDAGLSAKVAGETDAELAQIVEAWPMLSDEVRAAILALIETNAS